MPKEYTLIGVNGTRVSPLEVTEDGDYFAGDSRAFNPVKVRAGGGGSSTLSGLTDVDISNPTDGQTLVYNAESGKWENGAGGGGLVVNVIDHNDGEYSSLDKTAGEIYSAFNTGKYISFRQSRELDGITTFEIGVMSVVEHGTIESGPFEGMEAFTFVLDNGQHFVGGEFQTIGADTYPVTNFNPGPPEK